MTFDEAPPPIPDGPPWPEDVVAALHAGCYDDDSVVDPADDRVQDLWSAVRADGDARRLLGELDDVRMLLGRLGGWSSPDRSVPRRR